MGTAPLVALLDVMPERSRDVLAARFEPDFRLRFATTGTPEEQHALAAGATVLLTMWGSVDADLIAAAKGCRLIQKLGVGTDKIDLVAAERQGVAVLKAAGINADAVAEHAVLLTLSVSRRLLWAVAETREGRFQKEPLRASTFQLVGRTVGLVGLGYIGRAVARRFAGFGVEVVYHDPRRLPPEDERELGVRYLPLDELLAGSDVLSLHLPSTPETLGMVDDAFLARTKPGVILINTARGTLVNEDALARAIADGRVLGAGLDVTAVEPLPRTSPLWGLDQVVVTPHQGGAVADNFPRVADRAYRNAQAVLSGTNPGGDDIVVWPRAETAPR